MKDCYTIRRENDAFCEQASKQSRIKQNRRLCEDAKLLMAWQVEELEATGELEAIADGVADFLTDYYGYNADCGDGIKDGIYVKAHNHIYDYILNNWS